MALLKLEELKQLTPQIFKVYPNPSRGLINISLSEVTDETLIRVFDVKGALIKEVKPNQGAETQIDLRGRQPGIYLIQVGTDGAGDVSKQVVLTQ